MPRGDGTGPEGQGPMTGRGAGYCTGSNSPGYDSLRRPQSNRVRGRRRGAGRSSGRRRRR